MEKVIKRKAEDGCAGENCIRLNPEYRHCPSFDSASIAMFPVAEKEDMGVRVVDNFCEEHIM